MNAASIVRICLASTLLCAAASPGLALTRTVATDGSADAAALSRDQIREIQTALNELGYDAGAEDGLFGPTTGEAISAYQEAEDIAVTGEASLALLKRLTEPETETAPEAQAEQETGDATGEEDPSGESAENDERPADEENAEAFDLDDAPDVSALVTETSGNCRTDLASLQGDLERIAREIRSSGISICEANTANYRVLTQGAETLDRCRAEGDSQAETFRESAADARLAMGRNCPGEADEAAAR